MADEHNEKVYLDIANDNDRQSQYRRMLPL